jgi:hypothetical protein
MVTKIEKFACDKCGAIYPNESRALACENQEELDPSLYPVGLVFGDNRENEEGGCNIDIYCIPPDFHDKTLNGHGDLIAGYWRFGNDTSKGCFRTHRIDCTFQEEDLADYRYVNTQLKSFRDMMNYLRSQDIKPFGWDSSTRKAIPNPWKKEENKS